jgi:hypothetical protein
LIFVFLVFFFEFFIDHVAENKNEVYQNHCRHQFDHYPASPDYHPDFFDFGYENNLDGCYHRKHDFVDATGDVHNFVSEWLDELLVCIHLQFNCKSYHSREEYRCVYLNFWMLKQDYQEYYENHPSEEENRVILNSVPLFVSLEVSVESSISLQIQRISCSNRCHFVKNSTNVKNCNKIHITIPINERTTEMSSRID